MMLILEVTPISWNYIIENLSRWIKLVESNRGRIKDLDNGRKQLIFGKDESSLNIAWDIGELVYENCKNEDNIWILNSIKAPISDSKILRMLYDEKSNDGDLEFIRIPRIIKEKRVTSVEELRLLADKPFSGLWTLDNQDRSYKKTDAKIEYDHTDCNCYNRFVDCDVYCKGGSICIKNCIITGSMDIASADNVLLSNCIVLGRLRINDCDRVIISESNIATAQMYNLHCKSLIIKYSKFYWFALFCSIIEEFDFYYNRIIYPYLSKLKLPENFKLDIAQFEQVNISHKAIENINNSIPEIKNKQQFFLTFLAGNFVDRTSDEEIAFDMADIFLTYSDLSKSHNLNAQLNYEKALVTNTGLKKLFVIITGAFYKPFLWIFYLVLSIVIFAFLYSYCPGLYFTNIVTASMEQLKLDSAICFSACQIIGANPTAYVPTGITDVVASIQTLFDAGIITSLIASYIKKYLRESI